MAWEKDAIAMAYATVPDLVPVGMDLLDGPTGLEIAGDHRGAEDTMVVSMTGWTKATADDFFGVIGIFATDCPQSGIAATVRDLPCIRHPLPTIGCPYRFTIAPA